jgi:hypothetical protein
LEDHEGSRFLGVVLRRNVNPIGVLGAGVDVAFDNEGPLDFAFGYAWFDQRIWTQVLVGIWAFFLGDLADRDSSNQGTNNPKRVSNFASHFGTLPREMRV